MPWQIRAILISIYVALGTMLFIYSAMPLWFSTWYVGVAGSIVLYHATCIVRSAWDDE